MKLAAQFVARNGSEFLNGLRTREQSKREFFFLKENHSLHTTFKRLTDAYSAVLLDSKEALVQLREDATDSAAVLQRYALDHYAQCSFHPLSADTPANIDWCCFIAFGVQLSSYNSWVH